MRRGGLRPALYAYGRAHKARDPCARRPSPSPAHKGRGHGRRGPRPLSPKGDSGPPPASASAPPPHGGIPPPGPPKGGHVRRGGRTAPAFCRPHADGVALRVGGFSHLPPRPLARWPEGEREVTPPAGGDVGCSHLPASFYRPAPCPVGSRTRSAYKGKWISARRHAHPLDKPLGIW